MPTPEHVWMVRAGQHNVLAHKVEPNRAVAIGREKIGDLTQIPDRKELALVYSEMYPGDVSGKVTIWTGQLFRFCHEIVEGDYIMTYIKHKAEFLIGTVSGPYRFDPIVFSEEYPHVRPVDWITGIAKDQFSTKAKNSMGSVLTVFNLDHHLGEIHQHVVK